MTGLDLYIRVTDAGRHQPYRLVNGLYKLDVGPSYATGREAIDYCNAQAGLPGRHPSPDLARVGISTESRDEVVVATEAPAPQDASTSRCAGCGGPLPPGRHGQRRRTCSPACRRAAARRAAAEATRADIDGASAVSHLPGPSEAVTPDPSSRAGGDTLRPQLEATDPPVSEGPIGAPLSLGF